MKKILLLLVISMFAMFPKMTYASSSNNPNFVTYERAEEMITSTISSVSDVLENQINVLVSQIVDLENRFNNLVIQVTGIQNRVASNETTIEDLRNRIEVLEATPTPTPLPPIANGSFVINQALNVEGYSRITVSMQGQQSSSALFYSDDGENWELQSKFGEDFGAKSSYIFPIKGHYYKVSNWGEQRTFNYTVDMEIVNAPTADFTYTPQQPMLNQLVTFTDTSIGASRLKWEVGNGYSLYRYTSSFSMTPTFQPRFGVYLTVENSEGIVDTKTVWIEAI